MSERPAPIRLVFLGADTDWDQAWSDLRRRHLFLMHAFTRDPRVDAVMVVVRVSRQARIRRVYERVRRSLNPRPPLKPRSHRPPKTQEFSVTRWLPERPWLPLTRKINLSLLRWAYRRLIHKFAGESTLPVVWCYALPGVDLAQRLDLSGRMAFDTDHDLVHNPNRRVYSAEAAERLVLDGARRASVVFSASRHQLEWLQNHGIDSTKLRRLRNGVTPERFPQRAPGYAPSRGRPTVGYLGVLSPWIDWTLFLELARNHPEWDFVVAGPWYRIQPPAELDDLPHVKWVGAIKAADVPNFLTRLDVALGLYRREPWLDADSMKILEYLAAGLPVVSTDFQDHLDGDFEGLVTMGRNAQELARAIEEWLQASPEELAAHREVCAEFLARHHWQHRADEALTALQTALRVES